MPSTHLYEEEPDALEAMDCFDDNESEGPQCPMCNGEGASLGTLGRTEWFRCGHCGGATYSGRSSDSH